MAIITFGGDLGAGKTVTAARVARALDYEELYIGGIFREMAAEWDLPIEEFYEQLKRYPEREREVDRRQAKLMREEDNLVVQGRVTWYFAKQSPFQTINFFLAVDPIIGATRQKDRPNNEVRTVENIARRSEARQQEERARYKLLYGIDDHLDRRHYDFLINTTNLTEDKVFACVMALISIRLKK